MTTTIARRTELAHRTSDGIDVYLFWSERTRRVTVAVLDARGDDGFEFEVDGSHALDAFNHPYAYAVRPHSGVDPQVSANNRWRTDHEWTNR